MHQNAWSEANCVTFPEKKHKPLTSTSQNCWQFTLFPWCQHGAMFCPKLAFCGFWSVLSPENLTSRSIRRTLMALTPEYLSANGYIILLFKYQNQMEDRLAGCTKAKSTKLCFSQRSGKIQDSWSAVLKITPWNRRWIPRLVKDMMCFFRPSAGPFENPLQLSGGNCSEIHVKSLFLRVAVWLVLIPSKWDDSGVYIV